MDKMYRHKDKPANDVWHHCRDDCLPCAKVEQETAESMQTLLKLDTIKARMKAASDALRVSIHYLPNSNGTLTTLVIYSYGHIHSACRLLLQYEYSILLLRNRPQLFFVACYRS